MNNRSLKGGLFLLMTFIGTVPFIFTVLFIGWQNIHQWEYNAKMAIWDKNVAISQQLTQMFDKNFLVLRTLAITPSISQYLIDPSPANEAAAMEILTKSDKIFKDKNPMLLTASDGMQMLRTDNSPKVNIANRKHFKEAMEGREYISDLMVSKATGGHVVVLEAPIFDSQRKSIGLIHRNFYLNEVDNLVNTKDTENIDVVIIDRDNNIISYTKSNENYQEGMNVAEGLQRISQTLTGNEGVTRMELRGEDCLVTFSRNQDSGWGIVTIMPYSNIWLPIRSAITQAILLGSAIFLIVILISNFLADRITRPIRAVAKYIAGLAEGHDDDLVIPDLPNDELQQMVQAVGAMRHVHEYVKETSNIDKLTGLQNLASAEDACRRKLRDYQEKASAAGMIALMLVDLDNFKKADAESGHAYGERVLKEFANQLKELFTIKDCVGRIEGDEFIIILDNQPNLETIEQQAEAVNLAARTLAVNGENAGLSASIGIAIAPQNGETYQHLYHAADLALFAAKENGRNQYKLADTAATDS